MGTLVHLCLLLALLIAPGMAALRLQANHAAWLVLGWYAIASIITYLLYARDKSRAEDGSWRKSERGLHFLELIGGWPGAFIAQRRLRHKSSKLSFQLVFWLIVALHQFIAIDYLLDWQISRAALHAVTQPGMH
ncbi:MAG: DUF1294 domain-containing protein [Opitutaceae bacterium]|nr:DUF1294 domain-containing protein [Opitutaceae bacterium]MBP9913655.1 DUF1294 domain-containing protein [Opitutaceae bacterium]